MPSVAVCGGLLTERDGGSKSIPARDAQLFDPSNRP
jgi:hypothetical protein